MQQYTRRVMNIGEKINQFDNQTDNSVEAFNQLFLKSLEYPVDSTVEIGEVLTGDFRELLITLQSGKVVSEKVYMLDRELVWSRKLNKFVKAEEVLIKGVSMIGYKAFDKDLKCRGFQYEVGKSYKIEGELKICENGFHFCENLKDVYSYYPKSENTRVCKVESLGELIKDSDKSVTSEIKIVEEISLDELIKLTDGLKFNTGYRNTGRYSTGNYNTGYFNTGYRNTGNYSTGNYNTGNYNTGNFNTGHYNTGHYNTGYRNTGNYNTGNYNTGNYNTGYFNTDSPTVRLFGKDSKLTFDDEKIKNLKSVMSHLTSKPILTWVYESSMTEQEKADNPTYKTTGGYLKKVKDHKMFDQSKLTKEHITFLKTLPNFDAKIFEECTSLVIKETYTITLDGKEVEISEESYKQIKEQLDK